MSSSYQLMALSFPSIILWRTIQTESSDWQRRSNQLGAQPDALGPDSRLADVVETMGLLAHGAESAKTRCAEQSYQVLK
jgi:hypothetical protein